jgi:UDP-GlcNAc:undecaprenyl-phosphate GlcNAc-1-phosphate transferase
MPEASQFQQLGSYSFMTVVQPYMLVFYVAFLVTLVLTPCMRMLAQHHGIVDNPDGKRKVHTQPIAYLGGVATFLGWLAGVSVSVFVRPHNADTTMATNIQVPPGVLLGAATVVLFGLLDDVYSLKPKIKLIGQALAAMFLCLTGYMGIGQDHFIGNLSSPKGPAWMVILPLMRLGYLTNPDVMSSQAQSITVLIATVASAALVLFIIVAACNATNLLDGLDGLCSGVTGVMSIGYLCLAVYLASRGVATESAVDPTRITLSLALLGAVLGFLPFNFNPASIFMGDTGSMFLGYICGTMMLLFGQDGIVRWFLAAVVIFGLPMLDTLLAIVRRKLNGKPIFSPDSNHFHHFLIRRGYTVKQAVLISYGMAAMFTSFALVIVVVQTRVAFGLYMVLFGWLIVAAFKFGMITMAKTPQVVNATVNTQVISLDAKTAETGVTLIGTGTPTASNPV